MDVKEIGMPGTPADEQSAKMKEIFGEEIMPLLDRALDLAKAANIPMLVATSVGKFYDDEGQIGLKFNIRHNSGDVELVPTSMKLALAILYDWVKVYTMPHDDLEAAEGLDEDLSVDEDSPSGELVRVRFNKNDLQ